MKTYVVRGWRRFRRQHLAVQIGGWVFAVLACMTVLGAVLPAPPTSSAGANAATTQPVATTSAAPAADTTAQPSSSDTTSAPTTTAKAKPKPPKPKPKPKPAPKPKSAPKPTSSAPKPKKHVRLCEYPAYGKKKLISPIPGPSTESNWNAICASNGGHPAIRYSNTLFLVPYSGMIYKVAATLAGGWLVVPTTY